MQQVQTNEVGISSIPELKSPESPKATGHRIFKSWEKKECWNNSSFMIGRDPERWRLDAYGVPVMNALRGCMGLFCHEYDHIIPYSKGGETKIGNCQILQTKLNPSRTGFPKKNKLLKYEAKSAIFDS